MKAIIGVEEAVLGVEKLANKKRLSKSIYPRWIRLNVVRRGEERTAGPATQRTPHFGLAVVMV